MDKFAKFGNPTLSHEKLVYILFVLPQSVIFSIKQIIILTEKYVVSMTMLKFLRFLKV